MWWHNILEEKIDVKKLFSFFLLGELILFSIIFSKSLYEVYGLSHIGDTKLTGYKLENASSEKLSDIYDYLVEKGVNVQIIKMPFSQDSEEINYEIYHSDISNVFQFVGLSDSHYAYHSLTKEDFVDGTGVFYADLTKSEIQEMKKMFSLKIDNYTSDSYTSVKTILYANGVDLLVLLLVSFVVMLIYVVSRSKENAVKMLLGFSAQKIVLSRMKETVFIELISAILVIIGNGIYYAIIDKISMFYILFLTAFLLAVICVNIGLVFLMSIGLKKKVIVSAIKNQRYSHGLDYFIQVGKIILFVLVSVAVSGALQYSARISEVEANMEEYKELNNFYSSFGFNSDEYDKLCNDNDLYLRTAKQVKKMYNDNAENAYVMQDCVLTALDEGMDEEEFYGMSIEELFDSYKQNYIVVNQKYLEEYIDMNILSGKVDYEKYTLFVPDMYQKKEEKLKEHYKLVLEDKLLADSYYGEKDLISISTDDINIVYVQDDYSVKLLSDYQYSSKMNIEIKHPIIIVDKGDFASSIYMDMLSNCQLAYGEKDRGIFSANLQKYGLEKLFSARTMMAPFMEEISSYQFVLQQSRLFVALFVLTLLFLIYVSNHVHINVHAKDYGVKYQMGYSSWQILKPDIIVTCVLFMFSLFFKLVNVNIHGYLVFVGIDLLMLFVSYRKNIVSHLYQIMNGGF